MNSSVEPTRDGPPPPSERQFGLRGMFVLITASCVVLAAVAALGLREPMHLIGAIFIAIFCALIIAVIEAVRSRFAPPTTNWVEGANPFSPINPFRDEALIDSLNRGDDQTANRFSILGPDPETTPAEAGVVEARDVNAEPTLYPRIRPDNGEEENSA